MGPVETATTAFGQGVSVTPIQQTRGVSAAINGGNLMRPYILRSISEPETNQVIFLNKPKLERRVISEETSSKTRLALEHVVALGTGRQAYIENHRVGGKTGTAQKVDDGVYMVGNYILSFIGFMPADNPQFLIYVAVDNPRGVTQYGGTVAAPIAQNVLLSIIDYKGLEPVRNELVREYLWLDQKYVFLNNVIGMNLDNAKAALKGFEIEYSGSGRRVIAQIPSGNSFVKEGSTVKLMLN